MGIGDLHAVAAFAVFDASHYHYCILIFTAIVAVDWLLKTGRWRSAAGVVLCRHCVLSSTWISAAELAGAVDRACLSLHAAFVGITKSHGLTCLETWILTGSCFPDSSDRLQLARPAQPFRGFLRRLVSPGLGTFSVARAGDRMVFDEMADRAYAMVVGFEGRRDPTPGPGDVLSIAAGPQSRYVYFELTGRSSEIFRLPVPQIGRPDAVPEYFAEGHNPAMSVDGRWLVYLREENGQTIILLSENGAPAAPVHGFEKLSGVLEMTVTTEGNLIVASGGAADPHLFRLDPASGEVRGLSEINGAVRYPAISPDGKHLAFSRRESGSWHLYVHDLVGSTEQRLRLRLAMRPRPHGRIRNACFYVRRFRRTLGLSAPVRTTLKSRAISS